MSQELPTALERRAPNLYINAEAWPERRGEKNGNFGKWNCRGFLLSCFCYRIWRWKGCQDRFGVNVKWTRVSQQQEPASHCFEKVHFGLHTKERDVDNANTSLSLSLFKKNIIWIHQKKLTDIRLWKNLHPFLTTWLRKEDRSSTCLRRIQA